MLRLLWSCVRAEVDVDIKATKGHKSAPSGKRNCHAQRLSSTNRSSGFSDSSCSCNDFGTVVCACGASTARSSSSTPLSLTQAPAAKPAAWPLIPAAPYMPLMTANSSSYMLTLHAAGGSSRGSSTWSYASQEQAAGHAHSSECWCMQPLALCGSPSEPHYTWCSSSSSCPRCQALTRQPLAADAPRARCGSVDRSRFTLACMQGYLGMQPGLAPIPNASVAVPTWLPAQRPPAPSGSATGTAGLAANIATAEESAATQAEPAPELTLYPAVPCLATCALPPAPDAAAPSDPAPPPVLCPAQALPEAAGCGTVTGPAAAAPVTAVQLLPTRTERAAGATTVGAIHMAGLRLQRAHCDDEDGSGSGDEEGGHDHLGLPWLGTQLCALLAPPPRGDGAASARAAAASARLSTAARSDMTSTHSSSGLLFGDFQESDLRIDLLHTPAAAAVDSGSTGENDPPPAAAAGPVWCTLHRRWACRQCPVPPTGSLSLSGASNCTESAWGHELDHLLLGGDGKGGEEQE
eukprot:CAMPEP_0202864960 /NCGR_PEP_ID=MMETSP1391-20130828/4979_1 /ASSEMBLY_ACC=CAM_ASM_000867 /TAXON_ID=1034604 /ORGANISM="Chlamydomonas leiostraca, Strain SAG 11-49" /LENGTH=520 /DNA_ID=CAMNT_0049544741 /DNA_START=324 /DNA_END=1883 /DNA_ORIENTATION=-